MRIGIDFDNTIVCYDQLFHRLAADKGLVDASVPATKGQVRDHLRRNGHEQEWIELQGLAYGVRLGDATAFPGLDDFLLRCRDAGLECFVISHKTLAPFSGPPCNLHDAAWNWLLQHGLLDSQRTGLTRKHVYLELTKKAKLERIASVGCDVFIDDLPELLTDAGFQPGPLRVLFDPGRSWPEHDAYVRTFSWQDISSLVFQHVGACR